jgi:hypothetical protein
MIATRRPTLSTGHGRTVQGLARAHTSSRSSCAAHTPTPRAASMPRDTAMATVHVKAFLYDLAVLVLLYARGRGPLLGVRYGRADSPSPVGRRQRIPWRSDADRTARPPPPLCHTSARSLVAGGWGVAYGSPRGEVSEATAGACVLSGRFGGGGGGGERSGTPCACGGRGRGGGGGCCAAGAGC